MPAIASVTPGFYHLQFGLAFSGADIPPPKPLYLTHNGEGKQLTLEHSNGQLNQEVCWYCKCVSWSYALTCFCVAVENSATVNWRKRWLGIPYNCTSALQRYPSYLPGCRQIPWPSFSHQEPAGMEFWTGPRIWSTLCVSFLNVFCSFFSNLIIRIRSNLYAGRVGTIPLLGVDEKFKKVKILVDITCNWWITNVSFTPGHNPIYPCCRSSTSQAGLEIARTIE
jgi:hypothetical protein